MTDKMTYEKAIEVLKRNKPTSDPRRCGQELCLACDVAIEALEKIESQQEYIEDLEEQGRLIELDKQHCDWCDKGAELCGTCRKFFDYHNDGGSDKCSAECKEGACLDYEPMNYCPNCGAKMDGKIKHIEICLATGLKCSKCTPGPCSSRKQV